MDGLYRLMSTGCIGLNDPRFSGVVMDIISLYGKAGALLSIGDSSKGHLNGGCYRYLGLDGKSKPLCALYSLEQTLYIPA